MAARSLTYRAPARPLYNLGGKLASLDGPGPALGPLGDRRPESAASPLCAGYAQDAIARACPAPGFLLDRYVY